MLDFLSTSDPQMNQEVFNEDVITYGLWKFHISQESRVFFKVLHNLDIRTGRSWSYWCAPEVDVIEITKNNEITAYEIKGVRKRKNSLKWPSFYEGIGQTLAYLNLPYVSEEEPKTFDKFSGGAFDFVYLVLARDKIEFKEYEKRIFHLLPIGVIFAIPNGEFKIVKNAPHNPIQSKEAKGHFLNNLDTLKKFSTNGKIFRTIKKKGQKYFSGILTLNPLD